MSYEGPQVVRKLISGVFLILVGAGGYAFWTQRGESTDKSDLTVSGKLNVIDRDDGKAFLRAENAVAEERRNKQNEILRKQNKASEELRSEVLDLITGGFAAIPNTLRDMPASKIATYFSRDQPFSGSYELCWAGSEDDSETYFVQVKSADEVHIISNFDWKAYQSNISSIFQINNSSESERKKNSLSRVDILSIEIDEDTAYIKGRALFDLANQTRNGVPIDITKFGGCKLVPFGTAS